ncbi:MAG: flagellar basal body P-ring formation chaperone FlgA [Tateyamaria sp.]|uniref:flagellar basal body P-ring formation chaperone FlgA n=2 Tax=Tateyamaria sp. TaxID=1929288 RepID=UPI003279D14C
MMRAFLFLLLFSSAAFADVVTPTRTLRPGSLITAEDLSVKSGEQVGMFDRVSDVAGQEARVALYAGRAIPFAAIGPPALINRNQIVSVHFQTSGLRISTEGRALERGGIGDHVRVMNLNSRATLFGFVQADGSIEVKQ